MNIYKSIKNRLRNTELYYRILDIYYLALHRSYADQYKSIHQKKITYGSAIFVIHNMERTGAVLLAYNMLKQLKHMKKNFVIVSLLHGPMVQEFSGLFPLIVVSEYKVGHVIKELNARYGCKNAILNTSRVGSAVMAVKENGGNAISLVHEMGDTLNKTNHILKSSQLIARFSDKIVFPSTIVRDSFYSIVCRPRGKVIIKDQGVYNYYKYTENAKERMSKSYNVSPEKKIILNVGTPGKRKGFDLFIEAAIRMQVISEEYVFVWVGGAELSVLSETQQKYIKADNSNIIIIDYVKDTDMMGSIYSASDIFFLSSRNDPFPSVVLDAMSMGIPVIAFENCGGFTDIVHNERTGYLVKNFNLDAVNTIIINLCNNKALYKKMSGECKIEAKKHDFCEYCDFLASYV